MLVLNNQLKIFLLKNIFHIGNQLVDSCSSTKEIDWLNTITIKQEAVLGDPPPWAKNNERLAPCAYYQCFSIPIYIYILYISLSASPSNLINYLNLTYTRFGTNQAKGRQIKTNTLSTVSVSFTVSISLSLCLFLCYWASSEFSYYWGD